MSSLSDVNRGVSAEQPVERKERDEEKEARQKLYKNAGKHEELRRRRTECSVEIRKQKGADLLMKRRNLVAEEENDAAYTSEASDNETTRTLSVRMSNEEVKKLLSNNPSLEDMRMCFESLRRVLSRSKDPPIDEVINDGLVDALVTALQVQDDKVRYEAAWALTNILSGTSAQTLAAVRAGATEPLIHLILHPNLDVAGQALWAVANIAGDSAQLRNHVIECHGLEAMLEVCHNLEKIPVAFVRNVSWFFSNICRHKNPSPSIKALTLVCQALPPLLQYSDRAVRQDAIWAVNYLTDGSDEQIELAINAGLIKIVHTILHTDSHFISAGFRTLGNVATGSDELTQAVIDMGVLKELVPLCERARTPPAMKECAWLISNIVAGNHNQIQAAIDAGLLAFIREILKSGDSKSQNEAVWACANIAVGGTGQQILSMVHEGIVSELCGFLHSSNSEMLINVLETIYTCLANVANMAPELMDTLKDSMEELGALDQLEQLQNSPNDKIYQGSFRIVSEFFSDDETALGDVADENKPPVIHYDF